ncbi:hypothetical protein SCB49_01617 [unidentified eubacterium SCB49]|nr:hypothetical protein SCB49_01617 [unidentified eubacterium SCB49]
MIHFKKLKIITSPARIGTSWLSEIIEKSYSKKQLNISFFGVKNTFDFSEEALLEINTILAIFKIASYTRKYTSA